MKALKFMLPVAALGLLASCSSEIDAPNPAPGADGEAGAFIGISLATPELTRVEGATTYDNENIINNVTLKLSVGTTTLFEGVATSAAAEDKQGSFFDKATLNAYFKIDEAQYNALKANKGNQVRVLVVANNNAATLPVSNDKTAMTSSGDNTWNMGEDKHFLFSGAGIGTLANNSATDDHETWQNAWFINDGDGSNAATIKLIRLASRFDATTPGETAVNYDKATGIYTATSDKNLSIKVEGFDVETHEIQTYWFANSKWFTNKAVFPIAGTFSEYENGRTVSTTNMAPYSNYGFSLAIDGTPVYRHPHYYDGSRAFGNDAIALVKTTVSHATLMQNYTGEVFVWNHYLLGSIEDINNLANKYDALTEADGTTTYGKVAELIQQLRNQYGTTITPEAVKEVNAMQVFNATNGTFEAYYANYIKTGNEYKVDRNTIYKMSANSFAGVGEVPEMRPGQTPTGDLMNFWFDLNVEVADWALEYNAIDF